MAAPLIVPCARAVCVTGGSRKLNVWKGTTGHIEQCVSKGGRSVKAANWRQRASAFSCHATTPHTAILSPLHHMFINTRCSSPAKPVRGLLRLVCTNTSTRLQIKHPYEIHTIKVICFWARQQFRRKWAVTARTAAQDRIQHKIPHCHVSIARITLLFELQYLVLVVR